MKRALEIDKETGTTFWRDAIEKEMKTIMVAFNILEEGSEKPTARNYIRCHLVFDIKAGSLKRKARFCADGSRIEADAATVAIRQRHETLHAQHLGIEAILAQQLHGLFHALNRARRGLFHAQLFLVFWLQQAVARRLGQLHGRRGTNARGGRMMRRRMER